MSDKPSQKRRCRNCAFWRNPAEKDAGECLAEPPKVFIFPAQNQLTGHPSIQPICLRPETKPDDYCAGWESPDRWH